MAILRIGTGDTCAKQEGYLNVDIRGLPDVDVVADATKMPFEDGEHDGIESRNLVEHFSRFEIDGLFKEWARVLKKGGTFEIETVDMGETMTRWQEIPTENLLDAVLGAQTYPENFHKMLFTQEILQEKLKEAGLVVGRWDLFINREIPRMKAYGIKV
jgi:predicted SAM-dependent methyltransferase